MNCWQKPWLVNWRKSWRNGFEVVQSVCFATQANSTRSSGRKARATILSPSRLSSPGSVLEIFSEPLMHANGGAADATPRVCSLRKTVQGVPASQQQLPADSDRAGIEVAIKVAGGDHVERRLVLQHHGCTFTTGNVDITASGQG